MKAQHGMTMVGLLVGLAISMLCLIALLTLFRTVVSSNVDSRKSSILDTQLQNSLTTIQILAQNTSFGYPSATTNIVKVNSITSVTNDPAVLWRFDDDVDTTTTSICQGITYTGNALNLLTSNCSYDTALEALTWTKDSTLASFSAGTTITFDLVDQTCAPYGSTIITGTKILKITASNSTGASMQFPVCLSNILSAS